MSALHPGVRRSDHAGASFAGPTTPPLPRCLAVAAAAALTALALLIAAISIPAAPATAATPTPPNHDPFYTPPAGFAHKAPGTILRERQVSVSDTVLPVTGVAYNAYQLLYRTSDATGRPTTTVTTVLVPKSAAPAGGRQLLEIADPEDSIDIQCAPSYQLRTGEHSPDGSIASNLTYELPIGLIISTLRSGGDVVIPDHEGMKSEYLVSGMEGHAALDSIRAVENFKRAGVDGAKTKVGMVGYSGGAHVVVAADELQKSYAPGLHIVGVAAGGVPVGNVEAYRYFNGGIANGVIMPLLIALNRAYPFHLYSLLNAKGRAFAKKVSTGCATPVFEDPYGQFSAFTKVPNIFAVPRVKRAIRRNALGRAAPRAHTFLYNGVNDEIVWIKPLDQMVNYYCAHEAPINYYRDQLGHEHVQDVANFYPLAVDFLNDAFDGVHAPSTCGQVDNAGPPPVAAPGPPSTGGVGQPSPPIRTPPPPPIS